MGKNKIKRTPQQNPPPCPSLGPSASTHWHVYGERPWGWCSALPRAPASAQDGSRSSSAGRPCEDSTGLATSRLGQHRLEG